MAIAFDSHPAEVITNNPEFGILSNLTEGSSYQNIRIRASIYIGGEADPVAVLEQPKSLVDWDFFDLLKSMTGKCDLAVGNSDHHIQPSFGSELLTGWSNYYSSWTAWSAVGRKIITAVDAAGAQAITNDLGSASAGDVYVIACESDFADTGTGDPYFKLTDTSASGTQAEAKYAGLSGGELQPNHIYFLMQHESESAPAIMLEGTGSLNIYGTFSVHKITGFHNHPGLYFHIKFEEVYENASNVTTIGDTEWSDTLLFIPVKVRKGENFNTEYLSDPTGGKFLSRIEDGDITYKFGIGMEIRAMYASVTPYVRTEIVTDAGTTTEDVSNVGWGMLVLNDNIAGIDADDETVTFTIIAYNDILSTEIGDGPSAQFNCLDNCYPDIKALSFVGDLGEEVVLFKNLHTIKGIAEKEFYKNDLRIRKVLKAYRKISHVLRTVYESEGVRKLIHELTYTDKPVWMFDEDDADNYIDVTVITDEMDIVDKDELIESEIEIEYYE